MPENASTRTIDRDRLRSRLVSPRSTGKRANAGGAATGAVQASQAKLHSEVRPNRPAQFDQSPVLFRLPAIAPAEPDDFATASESPHEQFRSLPSQASEIRNDDEVTLDIAHDKPQAHVSSTSPQVPGQLSPSQVERSEPPTADIVDQPQLASRVATPQVEAAQASAVAPAIEANSEQRRTWWEHWSSGVVLILLVIALVVASIIALNDGGKLKSNQMAGQLEPSTLDEFDLSSIAIPDISMPPLGATAGRPLSTVAQSPPAIADTTHAPTPTPTPAEPASSNAANLELAAVDRAPSENAGVEPTVVDKTAGETTVADKVAVDGAASSQTAVDSAAEQARTAPEPAAQAAPKLAAQATAESIPPLPLATLDRPTEVAAPQLFAPQELPGEAGSSTAAQRISSLPASNPTVSLELPQAEANRGEGSSPTFYDGASIAGGAPAASGTPVSDASGSLIIPVDNSAYGPHSFGTISSSSVGPVDTNLPDISTVLASATARLGAGVAPAAQVVKSATPDLNGESMVEAYLRFQQLHQATTGPTSNRYPDPPPTR